jgi:hypothetical protein
MTAVSPSNVEPVDLGQDEKAARANGTGPDARSRSASAALRQEAVAVRAQAQVTHRTSAKRRDEAAVAHRRAIAVRRELKTAAVSSSDAHDGSQVAYILKEDPELATNLPPELRRIATERLRAPVIVLEGGRTWEPPEVDPMTTYGLLVLDGLLARRIRVGDALSTELIGPGDILRPWDEPCLYDLVPPEFDWRVLSAARLAVLDRRVTALICRRPELVMSFSSRLVRRARYAEYMMAAGNFRHIERRLLVAFSHLASLWGYVTPEGVVIPFRLTHEMLAEMIGAKRPTVSTALQALQRRGRLIPRSGGGYLLTGDPEDLNRF